MSDKESAFTLLRTFGHAIIRLYIRQGRIPW